MVLRLTPNIAQKSRLAKYANARDFAQNQTLIPNLLR
jgi:hypothetical protein